MTEPKSHRNEKKINKNLINIPVHEFKTSLA